MHLRWKNLHIRFKEKKKWCQCKYESHAIFILLSEDDLFIVYVFENIHTVESIVNEKRKLFLLYSINQSCAFMNMEIEKCRWHTAIMQVSYKSRKECFDIMPIKYWQIFINEIKSKFTSFHQYIYIITNNSRDAINSHKYKISSQNYKLYPLSRESEGKKTREKQKEKKKKKNSIPTGKKNHVTFDKGHRWPQLFHGIPGTWLTVSWMLVPSQEAVHDEITGARYEHTSERVYTGEGREGEKDEGSPRTITLSCLASSLSALRCRHPCVHEWTFKVID